MPNRTRRDELEREASELIKRLQNEAEQLKREYAEAVKRLAGSA